MTGTNWDFDVVCVGAGLGGLAAAVAASEHGLRTLVLEKSEQLGGVTALSGGLLWVAGSHLEADAGIDDSWEEGADYLERASAGSADRARLRSMLRAAPEALRFYEERAGVAWSIAPGVDYCQGIIDGGLAEGRYVEVQPFAAAQLGPWQERTRLSTFTPYRLTHHEVGVSRRHGTPIDLALHEERLAVDVRTAGPALTGYLLKAAMDRGVEIVTGADVRALTRDPGGETVTGVEVTVGGEQVRITAARGVVLATSGYDRNADLVRLLDHHETYGAATNAAVTGDHLVLAGMVGAQTTRYPKPSLFGVLVPGEVDDEGAPRWRLISPQPGSILVNRTGRRFCNEAHYVSISHALNVIDGVTQQRPNVPMYLVFGDAARARFEALPDPAEHPGIVLRRDTLEELAEGLGIDPVGLADQVDRSNAATAKGADDDFHRGESLWERHRFPETSTPADIMGVVSGPPFYGLRLHPVGIGFGATGLVADNDGRVLDWTGAPIPGLYGAGNSLAHVEIGSGYQSGFANTRGLTYGYLAACHMAKQAPDGAR